VFAGLAVWMASSVAGALAPPTPAGVREVQTVLDRSRPIVDQLRAARRERAQHRAAQRQADARQDTDGSAREANQVAQIDRRTEELEERLARLRNEAIQIAMRNWQLDHRHCQSVAYHPLELADGSTSQTTDVVIGESAFRSPAYLADVLYHEFVHCDQYSNGDFSVQTRLPYDSDGARQELWIRECQAHGAAVAHARELGLSEADIDLERRSVDEYRRQLTEGNRRWLDGAQGSTDAMEPNARGGRDVVVRDTQGREIERRENESDFRLSRITRTAYHPDGRPSFEERTTFASDGIVTRDSFTRDAQGRVTEESHEEFDALGRHRRGVRIARRFDGPTDSFGSFTRDQTWSADANGWQDTPRAAPPTSPPRARVSDAPTPPARHATFRFGVGVRAGVALWLQDRIAQMALGAHARFAVTPDRRGSVVLPIDAQLGWGWVLFAVALGFQYEIALPHGFALVPRLSVGYAGLFLDRGPGQHAAQIVPEAVVLWRFAQRWHVGLAPATFAFLLGGGPARVLYRLTAAAGVDF